MCYSKYSPCQGCTERTIEPNCHSNACAKWSEWKKVQVAEAEARRKALAENGAIVEVASYKFRKKKVSNNWRRKTSL